MRRKVFQLLVDNTSGVLSRISGLFSRRGYNIESITAGVTADPRYTRITIVTSGDDEILEQIEKQLAKLVDIRDIKELKPEESVYRELAMVKVKASAEKAKAGVEAAKDSVTDAVETAQIKAMLAQDELREVTQSAMDRAADAAATVKGNVEAGREGARNAAEQGKQKLNASALKAQMSLRAAKEDMQAKIEAAKLARDQKKLEKL